MNVARTWLSLEETALCSEEEDCPPTPPPRRRRLSKEAVASTPSRLASAKGLVLRLTRPRLQRVLTF